MRCGFLQEYQCAYSHRGGRLRTLSRVPGARKDAQHVRQTEPRASPPTLTSSWADALQRCLLQPIEFRRCEILCPHEHAHVGSFLRREEPESGVQGMATQAVASGEVAVEMEAMVSVLAERRKVERMMG